MSRLDAFPEELLESILAYVVFSSKPTASQRQLPLLVSRKFYRIGHPLYFHTICLHSRTQLRLLLVSLRTNPDLAAHIRHLTIEGVWDGAGSLFNLCSNLRVLDVLLDGPHSRSMRSYLDCRVDSVEDFCEPLDKLTSIKHLRVRKSTNMYLTQPKARSFFSNIAKAVSGWKDLECVDLQFRLSDDSGTPHALLPFALPHPFHLPVTSASPTLRPPAANAGPLAQLTHALSTLPNLHTFATHLPNVWNENILRVSQNPALERIVLISDWRPIRTQTSQISRNSAGSPPLNYSAKDLYPGPVRPYIPNPNPSSGYTYSDVNGSSSYVNTHFSSQAQNHPRLCELIKAGVGFGFGVPDSSSVRSRALTIDTPTPSTFASSKPSNDSPQPQSTTALSSPSYYATTGGAVTPIQVTGAHTLSQNIGTMRLSTSVP